MSSKTDVKQKEVIEMRHGTLTKKLLLGHLCKFNGNESGLELPRSLAWLRSLAYRSNISLVLPKLYSRPCRVFPPASVRRFLR